MSASRQLAADDAGLRQACVALARGEPVGMPTETVYGLAADASNPQAVAKIYALKGRPAFNPLIAHVVDSKAAAAEGELDERALSLADRFWPGPLTLVVPVKAGGSVCELARAGLQTIALRVPAHPVAQALLKACGHPLAAPSANRSGRISPTAAIDVIAELEAAAVPVLDGGPSVMGIESTIIAVLPNEPVRLLRPGALGREALESLLGPLAGRGSEPSPQAPTAPGQLSSHYAPGAPLRMNVNAAKPGERLLGFGPSAPAGALNLSPTGDTVEAAANLYRMLRQLDATNPAAIVVMPIPDEGLGEAINDRLRRAAAPRGASAET